MLLSAHAKYISARDRPLKECTLDGTVRNKLVVDGLALQFILSDTAAIHTKEDFNVFLRMGDAYLASIIEEIVGELDDHQQSLILEGNNPSDESWMDLDQQETARAVAKIILHHAQGLIRLHGVDRIRAIPKLAI